MINQVIFWLIYFGQMKSYFKNEFFRSTLLKFGFIAFGIAHGFFIFEGKILLLSTYRQIFWQKKTNADIASQHFFLNYDLELW